MLDFETHFTEPGGKTQGNVGIAAGVSPACHHSRDIFVELGASGRGAPGSVVEVFVENERSAGIERGCDFRENFARVVDETEHPAAPGSVGADRWKFAGFKIDAVRCDVADGAIAAARTEGFEESIGFVDGDDVTFRAYSFRKVERCESRTAADVEPGLAALNSRRLPGGKRVGAPGVVLEAETRDFLVVGAEDVVVFVGGHRT